VGAQRSKEFRPEQPIRNRHEGVDGYGESQWSGRGRIAQERAQLHQQGKRWEE
jgi:hypothetical protein